MHLVLTQCKRLEGEVVAVLLLLPLRWSSRAESVRKLLDCEETLGIVVRYVLRCHAGQESKIISLDSLGSAKVLELTDFAMTVRWYELCGGVWFFLKWHQLTRTARRIRLQLQKNWLLVTRKPVYLLDLYWQKMYLWPVRCLWYTKQRKRTQLQSTCSGHLME